MASKPRRYSRHERDDSPAMHQERRSSTKNRRMSNASERLPAPAAPAASKDPRERERRSRDPRYSRRRSPSPPRPQLCQNDLCRKPEIRDDEEPGRGPRGILLCRKCYRRYKLEKRVAREEERRMTSDWKTPRRKRSPTKEVIKHASSDEKHVPVVAVVEERNSVVSSSSSRPQAKSIISTAPSSPLTPLHSPSTPTSPQRQSPIPSSYFTKSDVSSNTISSMWEDIERGREHRSRSRRPRSRQRRHYSPDDSNSDEKRRHRRHPSAYDEAEYFKYGRMEDPDDEFYARVGCCNPYWSNRRKCVIYGGIVFSTLMIVMFIVLGVTLSKNKGFSYTPSFAQVNNTEAFATGGATTANVNGTNDGRGLGRDVYEYYSGNETNFPSYQSWMSFDAMWTANLDTMTFSCSRLGEGEDNTNEILQDIYDAIQDRANASLVDHRVILATMLQESKGCVRVGSTTSSGGVRNPGLMQSHNGHSYDPNHSQLSIYAMIQDGTQGTEHGDGLVQNLNIYGNPYKAFEDTTVDISRRAETYLRRRERRHAMSATWRIV